MRVQSMNEISVIYTAFPGFPKPPWWTQSTPLRKTNIRGYDSWSSINKVHTDQFTARHPLQDLS